MNFPVRGPLLVLTCLFALAACGDQDVGNDSENADGYVSADGHADESAHIGQWEDLAEGSRGQMLVFNEDGTFMMRAPDVGESIEGAYDIEYREDYAALDLHIGADKGLMIVDFPEADVMRAKAPNHMGGERPTHFEPEEGTDIILLTRRE